MILTCGQPSSSSSSGTSNVFRADMCNQLLLPGQPINTFMRLKAFTTLRNYLHTLCYRRNQQSYLHAMFREPLPANVKRQSPHRTLIAEVLPWLRHSEQSTQLVACAFRAVLWRFHSTHSLNRGLCCSASAERAATPAFEGSHSRRCMACRHTSSSAHTNNPPAKITSSRRMCTSSQQPPTCPKRCIGEAERPRRLRIDEIVVLAV